MRAKDLLPALESVLKARTVEDAWNSFARQAGQCGFAHQVYGANRVLRGSGTHAIVDGIELSSLPRPLAAQIQDRALSTDLPMLVWITRNRGAQSFEWARRRGLAGRLTAPQAAALALFEQFGHGAGIALSLADQVPRIRAGLLFVGGVGTSQDMIDARWDRYGRELQLLASLLHERLTSLPYRSPGQVLTIRQREALELTGLGHSTQEIAAQMEVSVATVEKHLRLARRALDARSTAHALMIATKRRLIYIDTGEPCGAAPDRPQAAGTAPGNGFWHFAKFERTGQPAGGAGA